MNDLCELGRNQLSLLSLACRRGALKFSSLSSEQGGFVLKSGRISPYFFNAGELGSGVALNRIGECYVDAIIEAKLSFDVLYGPAYKGIPLATAVATSLAHFHTCRDCDYPLAFNRKESKDHGEGGDLIGSVAGRRVLIIDDVITKGTAFREAAECIVSHGGTLAGLVLLLDRQEKGRDTDLSAVQQVEAEYGIPVVSVLTFDHLMAYVRQNRLFASELVEDMESYRRQYGVEG
jgi:orotate phosphoribosyltransferase